MQLIDRDKLKTAICSSICIASANGSGKIEKCDSDYCAIQRLIDEQPTIEAEPVRHGMWDVYPSIFHAASDGYNIMRCSHCKWSIAAPQLRKTDKFNFCPNCGARMDGGIQNE